MDISLEKRFADCMALFWISVSGSGWGKASCSAIQALRSRYETGSSKMAAPTGTALGTALGWCLALSTSMDVNEVVGPCLLRFGGSWAWGAKNVE